MSEISYIPGHHVHYIQASLGNRHPETWYFATLEHVDNDGAVAVYDGTDEKLIFANYIEPLKEQLYIGQWVEICERFHVMRAFDPDTGSSKLYNIDMYTATWRKVG